MEACDLKVSPRTQARISLLRRPLGMVLLGTGLLVALGSGLLLYGTAAVDTEVTSQLAFSQTLESGIGQALASLPSPDIATIVFNLDADPSESETLNDSLGGDSLDTRQKNGVPGSDYNCLPAFPADPSITALGQNLSTWSNQVNQSSQSQVSQWVANITAQLEAADWPQIHGRAEIGRVPVIMYHDVLAEKEVSFDITPERLNADFRAIQAQGLTPISLDQLTNHLRTGVPLPEKPVVLTFDDGYVGHYNYVYQLAKYYNYPIALSIFTDKVDGKIVGRSTVTWDQLEEMVQHPLVTIVSHSVTHPQDLTKLSDEDLRHELETSKERLENKLGIPIDYFTYPEGNHDERVVAATKAAGYKAGLIMNELSGQFAGASKNLLTIERFGESRFAEVIASAWGGPPLPGFEPALTFEAPVRKLAMEIDEISFTLISGGRPQTIHADSRYPLTEIANEAGAVAAVDGTFFSLEYLDSNTMIGPVLSQNTGKFVPGSEGDIYKLKDRPLVLISPQTVEFISFDPKQHNTLAGIQAEMPTVTDAFVGGSWLVREQEPQPAHTFKNLFAYEEHRFRAFWGINFQGQPVVGATHGKIDSVGLGKLLLKAGFQTAVMLDSGASTSLVYEGESLVAFEPRTVPHAVVLVTQGGVCGISG
ncbi:polysaccharide deacetylase family protein [Leptothoe sp. PORK10 BA2]|uniref:polysaccharide deacetylase family protein n=1 Tax=Leptothoe sp. PORK10 BA2 TaxID=3110254 RepID=UPI002B1F957A|nr:polysaccharide deacetylase family protein [Leptothoe sp. PORK10 BA2]MEA5466173.1 polysaccharide deacetylase family protein [Leptothoe sp. PORK10 BA2]